jgi:tRNA uridine 5-carbamoylmethylation protein Kti12
MRKRFKPNGIIFVNTPFSVCLEVNSQRPKPVPVEVLERMFISMEVPEPSPSEPVLVIDSGMARDQSSVLESVLQDQEFWFRVIDSARSSHSHSKLETEPLSLRQQILNQAESRFRKCVSHLVSKWRVPECDMKRITRLKAAYMSELKANISPESQEERALDLLDSLSVRFSRELAQFE